MLPKVLEIVEDSPDVYDETAYFIEAVDWLTSQMTGTLKRSSCAAGFKGIWNEKEGYVSKEFLKALHPSLENLYETKLAGEVVAIGEKSGYLTAEFAEKIGLRPGIPVAMGMIDAHAGMPGAGVTTPHKMVIVMGTSSCHMLLSDKERFVEGISGVIKNSIVPGYFAYEAGQAAVGDIFSWFTNESVPAYILEKDREQEKSIHQFLVDFIKKLTPGANGLLALDWHNGCRTPLVDSDLSGLFIGLTLSTKPEEMYRALRSEEHTSELQSRGHLVCRLLLEKKIHSIHAYSVV